MVLFCVALGPTLLSFCTDETRCSHATECETGLICSNVADPEAEGVCVDKCDPRVTNQAPCYVDAGSGDAAKDGASEGGMGSNDGGMK